MSADTDSAPLRPLLRNERGVALLIVLLVTALLIALIFEFAYATRISLNSAVNFRDSQRAYFLARSGINAFIAGGQGLRGLIPPGDWYPLPIQPDESTVIMVKWEDESGKIKINDIKNDPATKEIVTRLFETMKGIDKKVVDGMTDPNSGINSVNLLLLSGLHQYMSNDDFFKVADSLTVSPVSLNKITININTASTDVLQSLSIPAMDVERIVQDRKDTPYADADLTSTGRLSSIIRMQVSGSNLSTLLTTHSAGYYKYSARAAVGGSASPVTKQIDAIVNGNTVSYWSSL
ncbi:MAG TPA: hypothetical protein VL197_08815 [Nitrospirota bacterium]|nr:hypothetical protein [Nitrospirota bacterium]